MTGSLNKIAGLRRQGSEVGVGWPPPVATPDRLDVGLGEID